MQRFRRISSFYKTTAIILLNLCILMLVVNVASWLIIKTEAGLEAAIGGQWFKGAVENNLYPHLTEREIRQLIQETWDIPFEYEPYTEFKERARIGTFVNVDKSGFRFGSNQGEWPPAKDEYTTVFLFGGSTTFGYGLTDHETIGAQLQEILNKQTKRPVRVYNWGRGSYFSTQERLLFQRLISLGHVPDVAVFLDGLNELFYLGENPRLRFAKDATEVTNRLLAGLMDLPMIKLAKKVIDKFEYTFKPRPQPSLANENYLTEVNGLFKDAQFHLRSVSSNANADEQQQYYLKEATLISEAMLRYLRNVKMANAVAEAYDISPLFVWQPIPAYQYSYSQHPFETNSYRRHLVAYHRIKTISIHYLPMNLTHGVPIFSQISMNYSMLIASIITQRWRR